MYVNKGFNIVRKGLESGNMIFWGMYFDYIYVCRV